MLPPDPQPTAMNRTDDDYMRQALELARDAAGAGDVPVGALIVRDGVVLCVNAAVNNQASHLRRLRGLSNLTGSNITLIPVSKLSPSPATAGIENAITRAEGRAASARTAASGNAAISAALTAAGVSADAVLAIAVRGHNENDVTVYHR